MDTIKYTPGNFKQKATVAVEDAILRYTTKEPPGRPVGAASEVVKFFGLRGMKYTDVSAADAAAVYRLGAGYGFNLFDGPDGIIFFGYFHEEEPKDIVMNTRFLLTDIGTAYKRVMGASPILSGESLDEKQKEVAMTLLGQLSVFLLVPEDAPVAEMKKVIKEFMPEVREIDVELLKPSEISKAVSKEYDKLDF